MIGAVELADQLTLLRRTRLLESLSDDRLKQLISACRPVSLVPGEALCHEGEIGRAMYVVLSGNLVVSKGGKQIAVGRPGDCFVVSDRSRHDLENLVSANLKLQAQAEEMDR